eukprot:52956-Pyramimonas_sp.AAC.1
MYDYATVSRQLATDRIKIRQVLAVPWKTHCALAIDILDAKKTWWHRSLEVPAPLPRACRPRKAPDPQSKRSQERQQVQDARRQELPDDLRAAFHDIPSQEATPQDHDAWRNIGDTLTDEVYKPATVASQLHTSVLPAWRPAQRAALDQRYGRWVTTLERAILEVSDVEDPSKHSGRAQGYSISWRKMRPAPGRPHMCDPIAEWWGVSSTLLTRGLALQKSGKDPTEAQ